MGDLAEEGRNQAQNDARLNRGTGNTDNMEYQRREALEAEAARIRQEQERKK